VKEGRGGMRYFWALIMVFAGTASFAQEAPRSWDTLPRMIDHYKKKVASFEKEKTTTGKILFLGNSITEVGNFKKLLGDSSVINRGIGGDITFGILKRLDDVTRFQPSKIFILIGINDLSKGIPEDVILENMFLIVTQIRKASPKSQVFVQSVLPVNSSFKNFPKGYDVMEGISVINGQLSKISKRFNYTYVDLYKEFTDKDGNLNATMSADGLHLNAAGYKHWIKILKDAKYL
jgi:lysophospholipase L1-like esterase